MTADDPDLRPRRFEGFHAYADDTPRDEDDAFGEAYAPARPRFEPAYEIGYQPGFAERFDDGAGRFGAPFSGGWGWGKAVAAGGVVLAVALGLWLGRGAAGPERTAAATPAVTASRMNVEVAQVQPPAALPPSAGGPLEVLPPRDAPAPAPAVPRLALPTGVQPAAAADRRARLALEGRPASDVPGPARNVAIAAPGRDAAATSPEPRRASFDCRDAPSRARIMVCEDMRLAALDRRMKQAYAAALETGISAEALRADQDDWLNVREEAARNSPSAVASVYRQRIKELQRAARAP